VSGNNQRVITKKRTALVVNPAKCTDIDAIRNIAGSTPGWSAPLYCETTVDDPGAGAAREALAAGVDLVVICGGDGTVTACMGAMADGAVPVAMVPCGTGNLLARNLAYRSISPVPLTLPSTGSTGPLTSACLTPSRLR
jgi:diacylglycerol kinase (ATP)